MSASLTERISSAFVPPRYLSLPLAGIDLSTSAIKAVRLVAGPHGLMLASYVDERLPAGAYVEGEIVDRPAVVGAIASAAKKAGISAANVSLPESKSYLFETAVSGAHKAEWRIAIEQRLDEFVPLPPSETAFDIIKTGQGDNGTVRVAGIGFAHRIIDDAMAVCDEAGVVIRALEGETFASARALLHRGDDATVLIIDVGKSTTKISIIVAGIPRFATTIGIGGHSLTLSVQKHFGVTEEEARKIKADRGIVPIPGNEDYLSAMLSTVSAIRDEISRRLDYWRDKVVAPGIHGPITKAILVGGNASVRGFAEYLEGMLKIPVAAGDVFANFASRDTWIPTLDFTESLAYATAIGLALRDDPAFYA